MIEYLLEELNLPEERRASIVAFSESNRLKPYVKIIKENPNIISDLKKLYPEKIKDNWDCIVELYRYNIKLSRAIYPYLSILENIIKVRLSKYLKNKYGENFYYNENLFFEKLGLDDFDKTIAHEFFNHKINKFVREEIMKKYQSKYPDMSKQKIKNKIQQIKKAISLLSDAEEYRFSTKNVSFEHFVESKPTLNYWITLLNLKKLYLKDNSSDKFDLKDIFPKIVNEDEKTLTVLSQKLDDVRTLRNYISHFNKIIYTNISANLNVWDIYKNIIDLFNYLGCEDVDYIVGDIACCENSCFEALYHKFDFLHNAFKRNYQAEKPSNIDE